MNIFALDDSPVLSAQWQHDKHVTKMTLETAQLVSQAVRLRPDWQAPFERANVVNDLSSFDRPIVLYGITHQHHPCARWARASRANLDWLCRHGLALADEYTERYGRVHKSRRIVQAVSDVIPSLPDDGLERSEFAQAMPDKYISDDPVVDYRLYYLYEKAPGNNWRRREHLPDWLLRASLSTARPSTVSHT